MNPQLNGASPNELVHWGWKWNGSSELPEYTYLYGPDKSAIGNKITYTGNGKWTWTNKSGTESNTNLSLSGMTPSALTGSSGGGNPDPGPLAGRTIDPKPKSHQGSDGKPALTGWNSDNKDLAGAKSGAGLSGNSTDSTPPKNAASLTLSDIEKFIKALKADPTTTPPSGVHVHQEDGQDVITWDNHPETWTIKLATAPKTQPQDSTNPTTQYVAAGAPAPDTVKVFTPEEAKKANNGSPTGTDAGTSGSDGYQLHTYNGGAAVESVKQLDNGATLTTTSSGAEIETTASGDSYVAKKADERAPASAAATASTTYGDQNFSSPLADSSDFGKPSTYGAQHTMARADADLTSPAAPSSSTSASDYKIYNQINQGDVSPTGASSPTSGDDGPSATVVTTAPATPAPTPTPTPSDPLPHGFAAADIKSESTINPDLTSNNLGAIAAGDPTPSSSSSPAPSVTPPITLPTATPSTTYVPPLGADYTNIHHGGMQM